MNHQNMIAMIVRIILVGGMLLSLPIEAQEVNVHAPEILILDQVRPFMSRPDIDRLVQSASFLNDPAAVRNLLAFARQDDTLRKMDEISMLLVYMTCHPEHIIIDQLQAETDPWQKTKLINLLTDFHAEEVFASLIEQFEDSRSIEIPPPPEPTMDFHYQDSIDRVCDRAYYELFSKLASVEIFDYDTFEPPEFPSAEEMDLLIMRFKEYWQEHQSSLLEALSQYPPETALDRLTLKPKPQPPEIAMIAQVKTYIAEHRTRADLDALMQTATFLDSLHAVSNLLDEVEQVHTQAEIDPVRVILLYMTCQPERVIQEWIWDIPDDWLKVKLFYLLEDIYRPRAFDALVGELDNVSVITLPPEAPSGSFGYVTGQRVCDRAYVTLFLKFTALNVPGVEALQPPPGASAAEMDVLIPLLQQYWQEHQHSIRKILSHQSPPTIVDALF